MPHFTVIDAEHAPHFDGATYDPDADHDRLAKQLRRVYLFMADEQWHTSVAIEQGTNIWWSSASARVRDLRKAKFGAHTILRRSVGDGTRLCEYRMIINNDPAVIVGRSA